MRNIELKARLRSLQRAREIATDIATSRLPDQHQIDTYFRCSTGRLKLREVNSERAELIGYSRQNTRQSKASDYQIVTIDEPEQLKRVLGETLGTLVVVEKRREIALHHSARIHIDQVVSLGNFLEFEAVLAEPADSQRGYELVEFLRHAFEIEDEDLCATSYSDLLLAQLDDSKPPESQPSS